LNALLRAPGPSREIIVVDDASEDNSVEIATALGLPTIRHCANRGSADARNEGAKHACASILVFVDCDVVIHHDALGRISKFFLEKNEYSAVFGSYDEKPAAPHFVSQYRNLLHHFTHQNGKSKAETFWTGLGAVRRTAFQHVGGFRNDFSPIEDVAFGLELADGGFRIALDRELLGTHLKRWTLYSMIRTDIFSRAIPWSTLVLNRWRFTNDLNTSGIHRVSVLATILLLLSFFMSFKFFPFLYLSIICLIVISAANAGIIKWYISQRGLAFGVAVIPLHFVHQLCAAIGFALAAIKYAKARLAAISVSSHRKPAARRTGGF
jgi:glycosyltransferase involved in cell wall biosynthesis